jgi:hypothetical protein
MQKLRQLLRGTMAAVLLGSIFVAPAVASPRGHSSHKHHATNNRSKTVHVKSYRKKNGTVVRAHNRSTPQHH